MLTVRLPTVAQDGFFSNDTWEEQPPDEIIGIDSSNTKGFRQLWFLHLEGLVRLFVKRLPGHDKYCIVRVFLLPDDVGRRWIKRDDGPARTFRSSLKILMADIIDFSSETWNGQFTSWVRIPPCHSFLLEPVVGATKISRELSTRNVCPKVNVYLRTRY